MLFRSVRLPLHEMGERAMELLLLAKPDAPEEDQDEDRPVTQTVHVPTELVIRSSTARAAQ